MEGFKKNAWKVINCRTHPKTPSVEFNMLTVNDLLFWYFLLQIMGVTFVTRFYNKGHTLSFKKYDMATVNDLLFW